MTASRFLVVCLFLAWVLSVHELRGQDNPATGARPVLKLNEAEVQELLKQLYATKDCEREAAALQLTEAGLTVIPDVGKLAQKGNEYALGILKTHLEAPDAETRIAAYEELRVVATGNRRRPAAAARLIMDEFKNVRAEAEAAKQSENNAKNAT